MGILMSEVIFVPSDVHDETFKKYEEAYGIYFRSADPKLLRNFSELVEGLGLNADLTISTPGMFLAEPLSAESKGLINDHETDHVAEISVRMQQRLLNVPIQDNAQRMIYLPDYLGNRAIDASFSETLFHEACGDWAGKERQFWVREGFAARLALLGTTISQIGLTLHFEDGFRPVGVQEGLFRRRVGWTKRDHPDWSEERIITEASSKTATSPRLASHKGGAAVDLRLKGGEELLDIGHDYPDGGALVYLDSPFVTQEQWQNRKLLKIASAIAGISMYVGEDWHLSFEDNLSSLDENLVPKQGFVASYGPIKSFDLDTGEITEMYGSEELDLTFEL